MTQAAIKFLRRGAVISLQDVSPTLTVLDYLRLHEKSLGTKEGCNEGDCGACTVALGHLQNGTLVYEPVNACILLIGQLHGRELVTVDDLSSPDSLHVVQQAMVKHHASQCGFCTPGFVMSLFTLHHKTTNPTRETVLQHIAGNLCRCTGYRPIIDAAMEVCASPVADAWSDRRTQTIAQLHSLKTGEDVEIRSGDALLAIPANANSLAQLACDNPDATIVSGATDVGLWITKQMRQLPRLIHTFNVEELHHIFRTDDMLNIGAAATYAEAMHHLGQLAPDIAEVISRIGSQHVRASGTIGGNIANGSPIGDMPPMLIALGATLQLRHGQSQRELPLENFFIAYGKQDRKPGELVWQVNVPLLKPNESFRAFKISKRVDQDISAVMFAIKVLVQDQRIVTARLAMGGMAATPKRASLTEAALSGLSLRDEAQWQSAIAVLAQDFQPISDMRASSSYRLETAQALLHKSLLELSGTATATRLHAHVQQAAAE
jgi:xanthine dehydrogenase small subunit